MIKETGKHLYFIQANDPSAPIKIGRANDVSRRLKGLQSGNADPLRILAVWENYGPAEKSVHRMLQDHRVMGEWFAAMPEVFALIERGPIADWLSLGAPVRKCDFDIDWGKPSNDTIVYVIQELFKFVGGPRVAPETKAEWIARTAAALDVEPPRAKQIVYGYAASVLANEMLQIFERFVPLYQELKDSRLCDPNAIAYVALHFRFQLDDFAAGRSVAHKPLTLHLAKKSGLVEQLTNEVLQATLAYMESLRAA